MHAWRNGLEFQYVCIYIELYNGRRRLKCKNRFSWRESHKSGTACMLAPLYKKSTLGCYIMTIEKQRNENHFTTRSTSPVLFLRIHTTDSLQASTRFADFPPKLCSETFLQRNYETFTHETLPVNQQLVKRQGPLLTSATGRRVASTEQ